jgi:hypothetical protein
METTLGIDLASQPRNTALCVVAWGRERGEVVTLAHGEWDGVRLDDRVLIGAACGNRPGESDAKRPAKVAIDAPFGWPDPFVRALEAHHSLGRWPTRPAEPRWHFERRETDRFVHEHAEKLPLSVSTDRIAYPAMRCAALLAALEEKLGAEAAARDGTGLVVEAYPDAALRCWLRDMWKPKAPSYKGASDAARARRTLVADTLVERLGERFDISGDRREQCRASDDCLDALVCALVGRAVALGHTIAPAGDEQHRLARTEGWIHLPAKPLADLPLL